MASKTMTRTAQDNKYLHRDFHISCDVGIAYVGGRYGAEGVKAYLRQYADSYLAPLASAVRKDGLGPLAGYFRDLYRAEEAEDHLRMRLDGDVLSVRILSCPALSHMKKNGHAPSPWYRETTETLYSRLAENAGLSFELDAYDPDTGAASFSFTRGGAA